VRAQINGDKVAVFDFWATWCGPCKVISPIFEKFSEHYPNIAFYKVDVEDASDVSEEVGIRAVRGPRLVKIASQG
jgi:thioredoxin 1